MLPWILQKNTLKHKQMLNNKLGTKNRRSVKLLRTSSFLKCSDRANHGRICYEKAIFSMLPFDTVAPSTPLFGVPRNMKEMKTCRWAVCSINCIRTSESGTLLPFSFSRSSRATLSAVSAVHSLVKASKTTLRHQSSLKSLFELQHESTSASFSCLRGYYSNMAPGTVKRAIILRLWKVEFLK